MGKIQLFAKVVQRLYGWRFRWLVCKVLIQHSRSPLAGLIPITFSIVTASRYIIFCRHATIYLLYISRPQTATTRTSQALLLWASHRDFTALPAKQHIPGSTLPAPHSPRPLLRTPPASAHGCSFSSPTVSIYKPPLCIAAGDIASIQMSNHWLRGVRLKRTARRLEGPGNTNFAAGRVWRRVRYGWE